MPVALHYLERWLDLSAGFVHTQIIGSRHRSLVVSRELPVNTQAFPHRPLRSLHRVRRLVPDARWEVGRRRAIRLLAEAYRVDLVHAHFGYAVHDVVPLAAHTGRPLVLSLHGQDAAALPRSQPGYYDGVIPVVAAVVVPSQDFAGVVSRLGFPGDRLHVIPAGVDTRLFAPTPLPPGPPVVAFVGRLVEKKGVDVLLEAFARVRAEVPDARLHIVGAGPLETSLPRDDPAIRHDAPDPERRREQVRAALQAATVVVTPSRTAADGDRESLLLVNLEAQASGRPVVTTRHGGIPEYVDEDRTALVVPEGDAVALAQAVSRVLTDRALAHRLAAAGPSFAGRFDTRSCVARVDDLYDELLERRGRR